MCTIKTTAKEYGVICQLAKQQSVATGRPVYVKAEHKRGCIMVTAPKDFLEELGF
jgi:hypothetical protein